MKLNPFDLVMRAVGIALCGSILVWSITLAIQFIICDANHRQAALGINHGSGWIAIPIFGSVVSGIVGVVTSAVIADKQS